MYVDQHTMIMCLILNFVEHHYMHSQRWGAFVSPCERSSVEGYILFLL